VKRGRFWTLSILLAGIAWAATPSQEQGNFSGEKGDIVGKLKEQLLREGLKEAEEGGKGVQWSWFNPITLSWSWNRSTQFGEQLYYLYSIQLNQPIFQSGAIYYSIKKGALQRRLGELNYRKSRAQLVKEALSTLLEYRLTELQLQIAELQLANDQIDLQRKREQFRAGVGDGGLLNRAGLRVNQDRLDILNLRQKLAQLKEQFQTISDLPIEEAPLPNFRLIPEEQFVEQNLEYKIAQLNSDLNYATYREQLGKSLLSVNLVGNWSWMEQFTPIQTTDSYYTVGIQIKLPLAPAAYFGVESRKASYLKSKLGLLDQKRQLRHQYQILLTQYRVLKQKEEVYRQNLHLYRQLVEDAKEGVKGGTSTQLDLETMENSFKIAKLQLEGVQYQLQQVLLEMNYLLFKTGESE
jgi:outer membrane protein TolC